MDAEIREHGNTTTKSDGTRNQRRQTFRQVVFEAKTGPGHTENVDCTEKHSKMPIYKLQWMFVRLGNKCIVHFFI